jgi:hypothetical protein
MVEYYYVVAYCCTSLIRERCWFNRVTCGTSLYKTLESFILRGVVRKTVKPGIINCKITASKLVSVLFAEEDQLLCLEYTFVVNRKYSCPTFSSLTEVIYLHQWTFRVP